MAFWKSGAHAKDVYTEKQLKKTQKCVLCEPAQTKTLTYQTVYQSSPITLSSPDIPYMDWLKMNDRQKCISEQLFQWYIEGIRITLCIPFHKLFTAPLIRSLQVSNDFQCPSHVCLHLLQFKNLSHLFHTDISLSLPPLCACLYMCSDRCDDSPAAAQCGSSGSCAILTDVLSLSPHVANTTMPIFASSPPGL